QPCLVLIFPHCHLPTLRRLSPHILAQDAPHCKVSVIFCKSCNSYISGYSKERPPVCEPGGLKTFRSPNEAVASCRRSRGIIVTSWCLCIGLRCAPRTITQCSRQVCHG